MSNVDAIAEDDVWQVQFPGGEVRAVTLDELDQAFQSGTINEDTFVLQAGGAAWVKLGDVAGLDAPDANASTAASSLSPVAVSPRASTSMSSSVGSVGVAGNFDLDELAASSGAFRPRKRGLVASAAAAAVALGGIAIATAGGSSSSSAAASPPAAAANLVAAAGALPQAVSPPKGDDPTQISLLSNEQKKKLLDADKSREAAHKAKTKTAAPATRRAPKSGPVFHAGGSKYDPLNSSL